MSTSLLYPYSSSQQSHSSTDKSSSISRAAPCISLGTFNYTACQGPSKAPLLSTRRYSPRPVRFHKFEQSTTESKLPFNDIESTVNLEDLIVVNDSNPTNQSIISYENFTRREKLPRSRRLSPHNNSIDSRDLSPVSNNLFNFPNINPTSYLESNSSLSPISPVSPQTFSVDSSSSIRFSPPSVHNYSHQISRLKKSQSTLIMPSLLTLLRPESGPSTPIPKDLSSRSLNNFTISSPEVRKCHTMVSLSPDSNVATTKVMNERKPRFSFLRRISPSKSAVFTSKSSSSLQSSLSKSSSVTPTNPKLRKTSAEMWPHPEHPEEGSASTNSFDVGTFASIGKFIDGASEEERYYGGGCSRCASSTSVYSRRQSTVTNDAVFCKLCLSDVSIREMYQLQQCQCRFCTYCMCTYTSLKIREGETVIECPDFNCDCKGEITLEEIESLVGKELFNLHLKFRRNKEIELDPFKTWCPRPGCDCVVSLSNSKLERKQLKGASCPKCKTLFCASCSNSWHPGKSCLRVAEHHGVPFNDIIKRCPRCKVPIERDAGCAQMQCKKCKHVFCWYCGISLEDDFLLRHYDKGPCKNKLGHSRASVLWHRAQVIIIFAGFGLLLVIASPLLLFVGPCLLCRSCRPCGGSGSSNSSIHDSDEGSAGIF